MAKAACLGEWVQGGDTGMVPNRRWPQQILFFQSKEQSSLAREGMCDVAG